MASVLLLLMDDEQQQHQSNSPKQEEDPASTAKEEPPPSTPRREVVEVLQYYVMLPLYVLLIVLAWLVAAACLVLAAFSRDVCLPNPDLNVLRLVQVMLGTDQGLAHQAVAHLVDNQEPAPWAFLIEYKSQLISYRKVRPLVFTDKGRVIVVCALS
jgi:hypothetical protein